MRARAAAFAGAGLEPFLRVLEGSAVLHAGGGHDGRLFALLDVFGFGSGAPLCVPTNSFEPQAADMKTPSPAN